MENPEEIDAKGGYVPGGILPWGPPGTGKTLLTEVVAGETGKPYVFVDPGAFIHMFMGVGSSRSRGCSASCRCARAASSSSSTRPTSWAAAAAR